MICKKCSASFPNFIWVDGKQRFLNKRKYCLECSPWGKHNTKKKHISDSDLICVRCEKPYQYKRGQNSHEMCRSCKVNERRFALKKKCVEYKGGSCQICQYDKCLAALCFHHIDPATKEFIIGGNHCRCWETLKKELDKCALLCNRCHVELHDGTTKLLTV